MKALAELMAQGGFLSVRPSRVIGSQMFVLQLLQRRPNMDQGWGAPILATSEVDTCSFPLTFASTCYRPQQQFSSFFLLCSGSFQYALISTTSHTPSSRAERRGCGSHVCRAASVAPYRWSPSCLSLQSGAGLWVCRCASSGSAAACSGCLRSGCSCWKERRREA